MSEKEIVVHLRDLGLFLEWADTMAKCAGNIHAGINESKAVSFLEKQGVQKLYDEINTTHGKFTDMYYRIVQGQKS